MQFFESCGKILRLKACLCDCGHEIRIADPARQHVKMQVSGNAGASAASEIHAQVISLRMINAGKGLLNVLRKTHHFPESLSIAFRKLGNMRVGHYHDVASRVGETIQDCEREFAAKNDLSRNVII